MKANTFASRFTFLLVAVLITLVSGSQPSNDDHSPVRRHFHHGMDQDQSATRYKKRDLLGMLKQSGQAESFESKTRLASPGKRPVGAYGMTYQLSKGLLFAWKSKSPHNEADATSVIIVQHGVDRNAGDYWTALNNAFNEAKSQKLPGVDDNIIRIAPLFFSASADAKALNATTLAWGPDNDWAMGSGSVHPKGSDFSPFSAYDELITMYSDKSKFPKVERIVLLGHGGGALVIQRYAALRNSGDSSSSSPALRYVIGNPSSMLYFTTDRFSTKYQSCDVLNIYYYGLDQYGAPYNTNIMNPSGLFKTYAARDVRYLVSLDDTSSTNGDQSCGARAQGGAPREKRSRTYWKYIHLLAGVPASSLNDYPGAFASLQNNARPEFNTQIQHKISTIQNAGHSETEVFSSSQGLQAIFGQ